MSVVLVHVAIFATIGGLVVVGTSLCSWWEARQFERNLRSDFALQDAMLFQNVGALVNRNEKGNGDERNPRFAEHSCLA